MYAVDVRLVSTDNKSYAGTIEVYFNDEWGKICFQGSIAVVSVVCAQLGYGSVGAVPFSIDVPSNDPVWLDSGLECNGSEDTLFDCPSLQYTDIGKVAGGYCSDGTAGVVCPTGQ